jgi:metal-responsive CopG/Arc/MetJ family transcriptional regulator
MSESVIRLKLNQQQLELLDATIERGIAPDRSSLIRLALREFVDRHGSSSSSTKQSRGTGQ